MEVTKPQPVVLFEFVKGLVTGKAPELGEMPGTSLANDPVRPAQTFRAGVDAGSFQ
jgi:hypothetical protein